MTMDSHIGLDYIVENPEYTAKLAAALDTPSDTVKKQVVELLSALCVYNAEGHARALEALEHYKELKGERYRLQVILSELRRASAIDYQTALVAFVNCLIISTPQLTARIGIRNEFIGLKLLPVLNELRRCAGLVPDLGVQLDVFDEQRESDEAQTLQGPHGVDLSSHLDVFYAILRQVSDTPQEIPFLSILQHLLRIDPREAVSDIVWDAAETLVHRATLLESRQDASRLLRSPSLQSVSEAIQRQRGARAPACVQQTKLCCHCTCHQHRPGQDPGSRKQSLGAHTGSSPLSPLSPTPPPPPPPPGPPPPPPPPPGLPPPPPPPPPPLAAAKLGKLAQQLGNAAGGPPAPPPPLLAAAAAPPPGGPGDAAEDARRLLPQQETPTPRAKMKTINWNKIPNHKVVGKQNIWSLVARAHQHSPMADLDWAEMEGLFCQQVPPTPSAQSSPRLGRDVQEVDRRRRESSEIVLLDGKRSLNVNIFLKQFRSCNEDIIQLIQNGEHHDIGAEKLRGLLKILPELDELEMLKSFDGDKSKLGNAEKFLLQLIEVPNYKLRIECMLLKEEFAANMGYLEPSINAMIVAGEDLMSNKSLQEVLYMVLVAGNFLNSGGYAGNAAGVKLSSLQKLTDIRANKPGMNLIHYVAMQADKKRKDLLKFPEEMTILEEATKTTVEQLQNEITALESRIKKVRKLIDISSTEKEIKDQMEGFLQMAEQEVHGLQQDMEELETVRKQLADFFCEDATTFKVEECFRVLHGFFIKFRQAVQENERRRVQEEQANMRRRLREEQLASKRRQLSGQVSSSDPASPECGLVDSLIYDIHSAFPQSRVADREYKMRKFQNGSMTSEEEVSTTGSPLVTRRRMGSFSGPAGDQMPGKDDNCSPDVTPNGSLRRRRSRVPSEDDDSNLMDFLRSSGHDGTRERKSWGSLDRSWARRARGGGRKRPELLSADFSGDRERPSSPSLLAENKPVLPAAEPESKPKAWRQKIEAWLQENEKEEKHTEELRRRSRRVPSNRRSLEADSESESRGGTLDTLPEEKPALQVSNSTYKRVYPDWRPTIEKTDVVRAMEAIEEAQPQAPVKDKSQWRKSNLNMAISEEGIQSDTRRLRRMRSKPNIEVSGAGNALQAIKEEEKRKNIIGSLGQPAAMQDCLRVYLRRPGDNGDVPQGPTSPVHSSTAPASPVASRYMEGNSGDSNKPQSYQHTTISQDVLGNNKQDNSDKFVNKQDQNSSEIGREPSGNWADIDSDNIETPPVARRHIYVRNSESSGRKQSPRRHMSPERPNINASLARKSDSPCRRYADEKHSDHYGHEEQKLKMPTARVSSEKKQGEDEEILGDGQFDRFSSTRRTRRYKKSYENADKESGNSPGEETTPTVRKTDSCPSEVVSDKQKIRHTESIQDLVAKQSPIKNEKLDTNKQSLLSEIEAHQSCHSDNQVNNQKEKGENIQKVQTGEQTKSSHESKFTDSLRSNTPDIPKSRSRLGTPAHRERVRSMIEPRQVQEALKLNQSSLPFNIKRGNEDRKSLILKPGKDDVKIPSSYVPVRKSHHSSGLQEEKFVEVSKGNSQKNDLMPEIRIHALGPTHAKSASTTRHEHDLNDEGFEETQSLVSETLSQGASSGCNYELDIVDSPQTKINDTKPGPKRPMSTLLREDSSGSGDTSSSNNVAQTSSKAHIPLQCSSLSKPTGRNSLSELKSGTKREGKFSDVDRKDMSELNYSKARSKPIQRITMQKPLKNVIPLQTSSLRKTNSQSSIGVPNRASPQKRQVVERSGSRTSLRSSRSSLASATSVSTVKNAPSLPRSSSRSSVKLAGYTTAIKALTSNLNKEPAVRKSSKYQITGTERSSPKKPLAQVQLKTSGAGQRSVPASRSSSSGSSIGPSARRPRLTPAISTSFKENAKSNHQPGISSSGPASYSSSSGSSIGHITNHQRTFNPTTINVESSGDSSSKAQNSMRFMRPTAASAAKDSLPTKDSIDTTLRSRVRANTSATK